METLLPISDNTGIRVVKCIKIYGGSFKKVGSVGDILVTSIQDKQKNIKWKILLDKIQWVVISCIKKNIHWFDEM